MRFLGEGGGQRVLTEAAPCLAFDDNPPTAGELSTATVMGDALTPPARLPPDDVPVLRA